MGTVFFVVNVVVVVVVVVVAVITTVVGAFEVVFTTTARTRSKFKAVLRFDTLISIICLIVKFTKCKKGHLKS